MRVVLAGSHTLNLAEIATHALQQLVSLPESSVILLRRGSKTPPGAFEVFIAKLAEQLSIPVEWCRPSGGRGGTFLRDVSMVKEADAVIAYFAESMLMAGGTGHVVEKAIDADKPVFAYAAFDGVVDRVGESEPVSA